ncbi:MAG: RNA polymerase sigma factor [Muribaculaceae bacterium]|nr:RNA polymerase sigma factor [Muribaculaceae bacterium]
MTREQFIALVEQHRKAFRRFLAGLCCGDTQLADDIAQESFVKAYLSSDGLEDSARFKAWLYRIGINTFLTERRRYRPVTGYDEITNHAAETGADDAFRYQELYQALDRLPDRERTSLLLFYLEGYPVKDIAAMVGVSEEAVRQHLSRGRSHLRNLMTK